MIQADPKELALARDILRAHLPGAKIWAFGSRTRGGAQSWWSWYSLMDFSIDMLRAQRDEAQAFWLAHPEDQAACARLMKYNELLAAARAGETGIPDS